MEILGSGRRRKKRQAFTDIETCFGMIRTVDRLANILQNGTEEKQYNVTEARNMLDEINEAADNINCDDKEKEFLSYQVQLLELELQMLDDFILSGTFNDETKVNSTEQTLHETTTNTTREEPLPVASLLKASGVL